VFDERFEGILREHLRLGSSDTAVSADVPLRDLGLDSMGAVALMFELEDEYGCTFGDDQLIEETFRTAETLWAAVSAARAVA
jgi:acyl carrier protein